MSNQKERLFCRVEFTFDLDTDPSKERYSGDIQSYFAHKAFEEKLYPRLNKAFPGKNGINWQIITYPEGIATKREEQNGAKRIKSNI